MSSTHPYFTVDAALSRAERRVGKLERLSDIGMNMAESIGAHHAAAMAAINEDRTGNPGRAFAAVARAVRMTIALETRIDHHILAIRNGDFKPLFRTRSTPATEPAQPPSPERLRLQDDVLEAIYRGVGNVTDAGRVLERLDEDLFDRETYDCLLTLPRREAVEAVCADLRVTPDWSLWSDDAGFPRDAPGQRVVWSDLCRRRPRTADPP